MRDAFAPLASHLIGSGYRVARVDLRGHGDSSAHFDGYGDEAIRISVIKRRHDLERCRYKGATE